MERGTEQDRKYQSESGCVEWPMIDVRCPHVAKSLLLALGDDTLAKSARKVLGNLGQAPFGAVLPVSGTVYW